MGNCVKYTAYEILVVTRNPFHEKNFVITSEKLKVNELDGVLIKKFTTSEGLN